MPAQYEWLKGAMGAFRLHWLTSVFWRPGRKQKGTGAIYTLKVQVPKYRPFSPLVLAIREKFPYQDGDYFDRVEGALTDSDLAFIQLAHPLSTEQEAYLEHGKKSNLVLHYEVQVRLLTHSLKRDGYLMTSSHRLYVGVAGVTIINTDRMDDLQSPEPYGDMVLLAPAEAVEMALVILDHARELEASQPVLDEQYEIAGQLLYRAFLDRWNPLERTGGGFHHLIFHKDIHDVYISLVVEPDSQMRQWYESTFTDQFSHELHEALFWRRFDQHYLPRLIEECYPTLDQEIMEE